MNFAICNMSFEDEKKNTIYVDPLKRANYILFHTLLKKKEVLHAYVVISILHLKVLFLRCMTNPSSICQKGSCLTCTAQSSQSSSDIKRNMPKAFMKNQKA